MEQHISRTTNPELPPTREVEELEMASRADGSQLIIGCDADPHHMTWESNDTTERGEYLLKFIMANNLDIFNVGNKPTFLNSRRRRVIDVTLTLTYVGNYDRKWNMCLMRKAIRITDTLILK